MKIESGIKIPPARTGKKTSKYPFTEMGVGDSFVVDPAIAKQARNCAYLYGMRHGMRFCCRTNPEDRTLRVWRTA